jgi:hypothetical protein
MNTGPRKFRLVLEREDGSWIDKIEFSWSSGGLGQRMFEAALQILETDRICEDHDWHTHRCIQCDRVTDTKCWCDHPNRNGTCSSRCQAAADL